MRIPIKATARVPINQAGYISATSDILRLLTCKPRPVHTFGSLADILRALKLCPLYPRKRTFGAETEYVRYVPKADVGALWEWGSRRGKNAQSILAIGWLASALSRIVHLKNNKIDELPPWRYNKQD